MTTARVTPDALTPLQFDLLRIISTGAQPTLAPNQLAWFRRHGYLRMLDPPHPPLANAPYSKRRFPRRRFEVTEKTLSVLSS